jgi:hypothetical protein
MRFTLAWLFLAAAGWAQKLDIPHLAVDRGSANMLRILFHPNTDKPIVALQWQVLVPAGLFIETSGVVAGTAAGSSGKNITCASRTDPEEGKICVCILAGGAQRLPKGPIAILKLTAAKDVPRGTLTMKLQKVLAVSADLQKIQIPDTTASITIR